MKKRIVATLLSTIMIMTALSGCGNEEAQKETKEESTAKTESSKQEESEEEVVEELEPVTLRIFSRDEASPDDDLVEDYINSLPQVQALNVTIELVKYVGGNTEYDSKIPLVLSTNEQMDIGWAGSQTFASNLLMGAYADISEFLEEDAEFYGMISEDLWQGVSYEDGIYAIPTLKEMGEQWVLICENAVLEKYNIDPASITDFEELEPLLEAHKQEGYIAGLSMRGREYFNMVGVAFSDDFYFFDTYQFAVIDPKDQKKVQSLFETEKFADFVGTMREWYHKGYIHQEVLTNEKYRDDAGRRGITSLSYAPYAEVTQKNPSSVLYVCGDPIVTNSSSRGSVQVIFEKCENKERAYEFLKLWNTDPEVKNAFYHGVPDVHYKLVDGKVEYVENKAELYDAQNWCTGNTLIATLLTSEPDDKMEVYAAHNAAASGSPCLGMMFNDSKVADKIAVINNVIAEYLPAVLYGVVEPEEGIEQLNEQLKLAGIHEVIAEMQAQYDAFLGN